MITQELFLGQISRSCPASFWSVRRDVSCLIYTSLRGVHGVRTPVFAPALDSQRSRYHRPLTLVSMAMRRYYYRHGGAPIAIQTEIESAIFRVMSNRRLLFLTSSRASLLISFQPPRSILGVFHSVRERVCSFRPSSVYLIYSRWSLTAATFDGVGGY